MVENAVCVAPENVSPNFEVVKHNAKILDLEYFLKLEFVISFC